MRVVMLSRDATDYARSVTTFLEDFERQTGKTIEALSPDSPEGEMLARTYDIVEYPTMIALSDDGQMQSMWRGSALPTISEVSYYVSQN